MLTRVVPQKISIALLEYGASKRPWPPEIVAMRKELAEAKRHDALFRARIGVTDETISLRVSQVRAELERLYIELGESLTAGILV